MPCCLQATAVSHQDELPWQLFRDWLVQVSSLSAHVSGVIAGANPTGIERVLQGWPDDFGAAPSVINGSENFPLTIDVEEPRKVGIDRLLNAVAANVIRDAGRAAVIVDSGTATTVDYVTSAGGFAGGAILPGFELSARALHHYTALLPLVSIEELAGSAHEPVGQNTRKAIHSGLYWGQVGATRELVSRLSAPFAPPFGSAPATSAHHDRHRPPVLLLTGGGGPLLKTQLQDACLEPHLALQGLALVFEAAQSVAPGSTADKA